MLEKRQLLTAVTIPGSSGNDNWFTRLSSDGSALEIWNSIPANLDSPGTPDSTIPLSTYGEIDFNGTGTAGDDLLIVDVDGTPASTAPSIHFHGGDGNDTVRIRGTFDDTYGIQLYSGSSQARWANIYDDAELRSLSIYWDQWYEDPVEIYGGNLVVFQEDLGVLSNIISYPGFTAGFRFDASQHLNVFPGDASILAGSNSFIRAPAPSIFYSGPLDINDNALILDYSGASPLSTLISKINAGRNSGTWDGSTGILSTTAHDNSSTHAIGYSEASDALGITGTDTGTFLGETVDATTLLARYTWLGDANLDGTVDADDFDLIRQDIATYATLDSTDRAAYATWSHGDFNYDGVIDQNDVDLMVNSYNQIKNDYFDSLTGSSHNISLTATGISATDLSSLNDALDDLNTAGGGTLTLDGMFNLGSDGLTLDTFFNIRIVSASGTSGGGDGFTITGMPSVINTWFHYGPGMIMLEHCSNIFIQDLEFDGNDQGVDGISAVDCAQVIIDANDFHDEMTSGGAACYSIYGEGNENNYYTNNTTHDGPAFAYCGNGLSSTSLYLHGNETDWGLVIVGNTITDSKGTVIAGMMHDALIAANSMSGSVYQIGSGIAISGSNDAENFNQRSENCVVIGNTIENMNAQGIQSDVNSTGDIYDLDCTIMNNTITGCGQSGLFVYDCEGWNIVGNICTYNTYYGIQTGNDYYLNIIGNTFSNNSHTGIAISADNRYEKSPNLDSGYLTIENNMVNYNGGDGIQISTFESTSYPNIATISDVDIYNNDVENNVGYWLEVKSYDPGDSEITNINYDTSNTYVDNGHFNMSYDVE